MTGLAYSWPSELAPIASLSLSQSSQVQICHWLFAPLVVLVDAAVVSNVKGIIYFSISLGVRLFELTHTPLHCYLDSPLAVLLHVLRLATLQLRSRK